MASYAHIRHIELDKIGNGKKRITRPPGGESSDIFGPSPATTPPATPRKVKNYMASTIFTPDVGSSLIKSSRGNNRPDGDSFNRLFGAKEVPDITDGPTTPKKNHQKSNVLFQEGGKVNGHAATTTVANGVVATGGVAAAPTGIVTVVTTGLNAATATNGINGHSPTNGHYHGGSGSTGSLSGPSSGPSSGSSTPNGSINGDYKPNGNINGAMPTTPSRRIPPGGYSSKLW